MAQLNACFRGATSECKEKDYDCLSTSCAVNSNFPRCIRQFVVRFDQHIEGFLKNYKQPSKKNQSMIPLSLKHN